MDCISTRKFFRRGKLPAVLAFFMSAFSLANLHSQQNQQSGEPRYDVTENGIIERRTEKVSEEDVLRIQILNEESLAENGNTSILGDDDLDALFESDGDLEDGINTPTTEIVKIDEKEKAINFSGELKAELGGYVWFEPWDKTHPLATFRNVLKFTARPFTDFLITGSLLTDFPKMDIGIYELYFNYTFFGLVDVSAGKRDVSWSLSRMLDTNILDDKKEGYDKKEDYDEIQNGLSSSYTQDQVIQEIFTVRNRSTDDGRFTFSVNIPIFSYASIQGLAQYDNLGADIVDTDVALNHVSVAGKIEGSIGKFSLAFFAKRWAADDGLDPALGLEFVSTAFGKNSNFFIQGLTHLASSGHVNRGKLSTGIYKYWENPVMLGLAFEYQAIWDEDYGSIEKWQQWQHFFAAQIAWSHFIFGKKWTFGLEWFHDCRENYGTIFPAMKIENIIRYTDIRIAAPIYYGTTKKYGLILEFILNLKY